MIVYSKTPLKTLSYSICVMLERTQVLFQSFLRLRHSFLMKTSYMQGISSPPPWACLKFGTDRWYSKTYCIIEGKKEEVLKKGHYFRVAILFGTFGGRGGLLSGITRKVSKFTLLLFNRYFQGAATFGTLQYIINFYKDQTSKQTHTSMLLLAVRRLELVVLKLQYKQNIRTISNVLWQTILLSSGKLWINRGCQPWDNLFQENSKNFPGI